MENPRELAAIDGVEEPLIISEPYKLVSREVKSSDTLVSIGPIQVGGQGISVIAGPAVVESREQILDCAALVAESGAVMLRSTTTALQNYSKTDQSLALKQLHFLREAGDRYSLPVVWQTTSTKHIDAVTELADVIQITADDLGDSSFLQAVSSTGKPVILNRGAEDSVHNLLMSAEHLLSHGAYAVIICEQGIGTLETTPHNFLDLSAVPSVQKLSHVPIVVDPSLATLECSNVPPMALAALAAGAHGLIIEVQPDRDHAEPDRLQALHPAQFEKLMSDINALADVLSKEVTRLPLRTAATVTELLPVTAGEIPEVAFQGEMGANSEIAIRRFLEPAKPVPCREFKDVFQAVLSGACRYGAIPIENSLTGSIHQNFELLLQFPDLTIIADRNIRIVHNLIGRPGTKIGDISRVFSHPQGLAQCERYLNEHANWEKIPFYDTAGAVAHLAREGLMSDATIASDEAAQTYHMQVLQKGIEDNPQNYTRFFLIATTDHPSLTSADKASLVFSTPDRPGALSECLEAFAAHDLNMTKLESRPIPGRPWEYRFYVDVALGPNEEALKNAEGQLQRLTASYRILGVYSS